MTTKRIQQNTMCALVEQAAIIALAVHLDKGSADFARELYAHRLIVDEGAATAIRRDHPAQDQFILSGIETVCAEHPARWMPDRQIKARNCHRLVGAGANGSAPATAFAARKAER